MMAPLFRVELDGRRSRDAEMRHSGEMESRAPLAPARVGLSPLVGGPHPIPANVGPSLPLSLRRREDLRLLLGGTPSTPQQALRLGHGAGSGPGPVTPIPNNCFPYFPPDFLIRDQFQNT